MEDQTIESRENVFMNKLSQRHLKIMICLALIIATLSVYWQVQHFKFVDFDDGTYVMNNDNVKKGMVVQSIRWAFVTMEAGFWHPLTWLSHMLDYELYRKNAGGHHWTSVIFHIGSTLLLFLFLASTTGALWTSGLTAALFSLHPLHVESVAWVAERKDVLSAFSWMLTLCSYAYYVKRPCWQRYVMVLGAFILGLMAKPMLVTLPFVLLLLDYWPLGRLRLKRTSSHDIDGTPLLILLLEKLPLLFFALLASVITIVAEGNIGALPTFDIFPLDVRVVNALRSYGVYIMKTVWPSHLAVFYPHPLWWDTWQYALSGIFLLFVSFLVLKRYRPFPYLAVGWLWYLGTLLPVIGLIQIGNHAMADRYTYIPLIGLFIMICWGVADVLRRRQIPMFYISALAVGLLLCLATASWHQVQHWQNGIALFRHAIKATENNYVAYNNLGIIMMDNGEYNKAADYFREVVKMKPRYVVGHSNLANAYLKMGDPDRAVLHFLEGLRYKPDYLNARHDLGNLYMRQRQFHKAIAQYRVAIAIDPRDAELHNNLGVALGNTGDMQGAIIHLNEAIRLNPGYSEALKNRQIIMMIMNSKRDK